MSFDNNVYYDPEKWGLTTVGEIEWVGGGYSFDLTVVWTDSGENLYWSSDSGCSCPSPFQDLNRKDELLTGSFYELSEYLKRQLTAEWSSDSAEAQVVNLLSRIRG